MRRFIPLTTASVIGVGLAVTGAAVTTVGTVGGCSTQRPPEAFSLEGKPLPPTQLDEATFARRQQELAAASVAYRANPRDVESIIWYGRRLAYLGRYQQAIKIYSGGLRLYPDSAKLLRHRGHRYITIRQLDSAIADLQRAAALVQGVPDEVEPDGLPNARNMPTGTNKTNIYYHLGLAHYLQGDFEAALDAYVSCLRYSTNDDMRCATSYWLYLTLRRLDRPAEAVAVVAPITPDMDIIENFAYHELLLLFKGRLSPRDILQSDADAGPVGGEIDDATRGYGVGAFYLLDGQRDEAFEMFIRVTAGPGWAAFGYIAAEAEIARSRR